MSRRSKGQIGSYHPFDNVETVTMEELGRATADEMVLAFLRAEIDSPRFHDAEGLRMRGLLLKSGLDPGLIDNADPGDSQANAIRKEILKWWCEPKFVFSGMPEDVIWRRVRLQPFEVGALRYCAHPTWIALSGESRLVADGAANIERVSAPNDVNNHVIAVAELVRQGDKFPALIAVQALGDGLILLEGHTRATAYVVAQVRDSTEVIVGTSPQIRQWRFYG